MLRCTTAFLVVVLMASVAAAEAIDLTSFGQMTEQGRAARYTTIIGAAANHTAGFTNNDYNPANGGLLYEGAYDYVASPGRFAHPDRWMTSDGISTGDYSTCANNMVDTYDTIRDTTDPSTEFVGYRFKRASTVTEIVYTDFVATDGGMFNGTPVIEVLDAPVENGGTWSAVNATWATPYSTTPAASWGERAARQYVITPDVPTGEVWGVRLIGTTLGGLNTADRDGWIAMTELQVSGELSVMQDVNLGVNLAIGATPIWGDVAFEVTTAARINDGDVLNNCGFFSNDTAADDWVGLLFDGAKTNVNAVGLVQKMFTDGGWFKPSSMEIQYLPEGLDPNVEANWVTATGLDIGRWAAMEPELAVMMIGTNRRYQHAELLTFDEITSSIDGIRVYGDSEGTWAGRGFVSIDEIEVFAAVPEPSTLILLLSVFGACLLHRAKR